MATLYLTEFKLISWAGNQLVVAPFMPPVVEQNIPIGLTANSSTPFSSLTRFIMINCDEACSIAVDSVANPLYHRMAANETRFYGVNPASYLSVIVNI